MCKITPCINNDIYEDGLCYYHYKYGAEKPVKEKKVYEIPKESKKRAAENRIDRQQNKEIREKRPRCEMNLTGCTGWAEGVQHKGGRIGKRLTDVNNKIPACNNCNLRAETHPKEALGKQVSKSRIKKQ